MALYAPITLDDIRRLLPWVPTGPILDIGCGAAAVTLAFAEYGFPVTALDVEPDTIARCRAAYGSLADWHCADLRAFELAPEYYAAIVCLNVFPFIPSDEHGPLLQRLTRALIPGGILIFSTFSPEDPGAAYTMATRLGQDIPESTGTLTPDQLRAALPGWESWHFFQGLVADDHPPHGPHTHGLVQTIVRKPKASPGIVDWAAMPHLGAGIGWRSVLSELLNDPDSTDFLEIMTDDFTHPQYDARLLQLAQRYTVIPHGVELSVGTPGALDAAYLSDVRRVADRCNAPWWSDHICYTRSGDFKTYSLNPLPATEEALQVAIANAKGAVQQVKRPLVLETVAYYARSPLSEMSDAAFTSRLAEGANCGILLDVANLVGNQLNMGLDPHAFIDALPRERVVQVHLAGGRLHQGLLFDTHDSPVWQETWDLLAYALKRCDIKAISLERDDHYDDLRALVDEVAKARHLIGQRL